MRDKGLVAIYEGLIKNKSAKKIGQELYQMTINQAKEGKFVDPYFYQQSQRLLGQLEKRLPKNENIMDMAKIKYPQADVKDKNDALALIIFGLLELLGGDKVLTKHLNIEINKRVSFDKEVIIEEEIKRNRSLKQPKVFYLASSHKDCATDHIDYQGKMYIDEKWKEIITDTETKILIDVYIKRHNTMTMQKVMDKPIWFITRPNCRHYFQAIPTERVLSKESTEKLIKAYKTNRAVGDRTYLQTLKGNKNRKIIGEKRNAELVIEKYKERQAMHEKLYKTHKSILIKRAIQKDAQLIDKWSKYLKELQKSG